MKMQTDGSFFTIKVRELNFFFFLIEKLLEYRYVIDFFYSIREKNSDASAKVQYKYRAFFKVSRI